MQQQMLAIEQHAPIAKNYQNLYDQRRKAYLCLTYEAGQAIRLEFNLIGRVKWKT